MSASRLAEDLSSKSLKVFRWEKTRPLEASAHDAGDVDSTTAGDGIVPLTNDVDRLPCQLGSCRSIHVGLRENRECSLKLDTVRHSRVRFLSRRYHRLREASHHRLECQNEARRKNYCPKHRGREV